MYIAIALAVPAILFVIISLITYMCTFYNNHKHDDLYSLISGTDYEPYYERMTAIIKKAEAIPCQNVHIKAHDGKRLSGRLYLTDEKAPFHILFNGYKSIGLRDFSGGMQLALSRNENVLIVDQRCHGASQGRTISFGILERRDVPLWADYLTNRFGNGISIVLEGVSMGAATVLMASNLPMPNVRGIWADCPYNTPMDVIFYIAKRMVKIGKPLYPFFVFGAWLFGGFKLTETNAAQCVAASELPIAIIHGTADHFVPIEMSREIQQANPSVLYTEIEGAPHALSYLRDSQKYNAVYHGFMDEILK